jgi:hypothetical protein
MHIGGLAAGRPNAYAVAGTRIDRAKPRQRARGRGFRMTSSRSVNGDANKWLPSVSGLQPRSVPNNRGDRRLARLVEQRFVGDMRAVPAGWMWISVRRATWVRCSAWTLLGANGFCPGCLAGSVLVAAGGSALRALILGEVLQQTVRPLVVRRRDRCWDVVPRVLLSVST